MAMLTGIGGKALRRCRDRWFREDERRRTETREASTMFDYDVSDDPC
jgi:hypothetical protein